MFAARGRNARITRELSMLGPAVLQMLCELLRKLQSQKEVGLEAISSMTRLQPGRGKIYFLGGWRMVIVCWPQQIAGIWRL